MSDDPRDDRDGGARVARLAPLALVAAALLAAASLGVTCGPGGPPPITETCEPPVPPDAGVPDGDAVTSVELGRLDGDGRFVPFVDRGVATLSFGGQGSSMLVAHLRVRGNAVPACLAQRTVMAEPNGASIASEEAALPTDPTGDGAWIAGPMYLVYDRASGVQVRLSTAAGGRSQALTLWIDFDPGTFIDAGVDAP